jgi:hypothetical protein
MLQKRVENDIIILSISATTAEICGLKCDIISSPVNSPQRGMPKCANFKNFFEIRAFFA